VSEARPRGPAGIVCSEEPALPAPPARLPHLTLPTDTHSLLAALGIDEADIEANRAGRLGPRQAKELRRSGARNLAAAFVGGAVLAAILFFVANRPLVPAQYITAGLLFAALLAVGVYDFVRTRRAASVGRVSVLSGPITVISRGTQGWHLRVADQEFRMPVRPWNLEPGAPYHVYFVDGGRRIVGMEPADGAGPA
jgi:hypothetical protein